MTYPQQQPAPATFGAGWYPDPVQPGFERRWDGTAWIGTPHKTPARSSMFGPAYDRAYWTNANPSAKVARWTGLGGVLAIVVLVVAPLIESPAALVALAVVAVVIGVPCEILTLVFGVRGIRAANRGAGALALSIQVTVAAGILLVLMLGVTLAIVAAASRI